MIESTDYIEPEARAAAWAAMAREYAARGWPRHDIAYALCVDEPTVDQLLAAGGTTQSEDASTISTIRPAPGSGTVADNPGHAVNLVRETFVE
ncbi:hypothetical protein ACFYPC_36685 [Streptomyces sp. NPDC005808]|uniref:hypothetical protein n=1 Tax=Streptomyces sp. NPDC005808 TaxID=3364734 RepID=UPI0036B9C58D